LAPRSRLARAAVARRLGRRPGDSLNVAIREIWRGRIWLARAWRLVEESPDLVVLANRPGAETRLPVGPDGKRLRVPAGDWQLERGRWENWSLRVVRPGERWSTLLFFDEHGAFLSWYVNLEEPLRRVPVGFDTLDWKLDLLAFPDGTQRFKDHDHLREAAEAGFLDEREVLEAAEQAVANPPWPTGWEERPPDPSWPAATLPPGWDRV
jgi:Protein of unknown function (DUF402)